MKKLLLPALGGLLFMLMAQTGYGQSLSYTGELHSLLPADSVATDTLEARYNYIVVTIEDTGASLTDTVKVYSYDIKLADWVQVGLRDLLTFTDGEIAANANTTRSYLVLDPSVYMLRVVRTNISGLTGRRTRVTIKGHR